MDFLPTGCLTLICGENYSTQPFKEYCILPQLATKPDHIQDMSYTLVRKKKDQDRIVNLQSPYVLLVLLCEFVEINNQVNHVIFY